MSRRKIAPAPASSPVRRPPATDPQGRDPLNTLHIEEENNAQGAPRALPEKAESDSHYGANLIQADHWEEASMDGETVLGGLAQTDCRDD